jgi:iron uptake system component EfeO
VAEAKKQFAPSRVSWERIEPIAGLVEEIDGSVDARVDDFASVDDPKWTGWHKLEYLLWEKNTAAGGKPLADRLDKDLATLETQLKTVDITPKAVALGAGDLIQEVSEGKITGEEDRYSHTDLWDFDANVAGAKQAYTVFKPVLQKKDPALVSTLDGEFAAVEASLKPYQVAGGGFQPYTALKEADKTRMKAQLAALSESLAKVPAALGVA